MYRYHARLDFACLERTVQELGARYSWDVERRVLRTYSLIEDASEQREIIRFG